MIQDCFDVLGIAPTKDENIIKKAYRALLHGVNPEDDPEGFQRLRGAYEQARQYAKQMRSVGPKDVTEAFIERCDEVYHSFFRRVDPEEWEALFHDPVCLNLETGEEIRRQFLAFLMEHYHFPADIWKRIDSVFGISGNRKELMEWFPEDYVDYLQQTVRDPGLLDYSLFEGEASEDFDGYIDAYQRLRQYTDLGMLKQADQELEALRQFHVYHPYGELEKARILLFHERKEEAAEILIRLARRYDREERIVCCCAQFLQMEDRWDEVRGMYDRLLETNPDSMGAKTGKAEELLHDGYYRESRECILDLLEVSPQDERLMKDLMDANVFLIEELEPGYAQHTLDQDGLQELGWCYYQNMKFEESIAVLDSFEPDEEHYLDYHNLKGRVYLTIDKNKEALEHLLPWLEAILALHPDGTKKTQRKLARLGYAYYTIGTAKAAILLQSGEKDFSEAMWYLKKGIETEKDESQIVSYYYTMADIWRQAHQYDKVVEVCDRILTCNQGYYPAVLLRQEACLHLGMYQEVVDDYQKAVYMYPYFGKPYATLIKMYFLFGEYDKAKDIFQITEENNIESDELQILTARYRAVTAKSEQDLEEALAILDALKQRGWDIQSDIEKNEWNEVDYRRGLILTDLGRLEEACEVLEASIEDDEEDPLKLYSYATVLAQRKDYASAVVYMEKAWKLAPDDEGILYRLGWCYQLNGQYRAALDCMKQVLAVHEDHPRVRHAIAEIYERMARTEEDGIFYQKALPYMQEQVKRYPDEYYLIEMGLLYLDMDDYEQALPYFERAYEINPESVYAYNDAGNCYLSMNMPEKAEPLFQKALSFAEQEKTLLPYTNLAKCYRMMGRYEQAFSCYRKAMQLFPNRRELYLFLGDAYRQNGQFDEAIAAYKEGIALSERTRSLEMELLRTYGMKADDFMVEAFGKEFEEKYQKDSMCQQLAGEVYLFGVKDCPRAMICEQRSLDIVGDTAFVDFRRDSLYLLGRCYLLSGKRAEAEELFRQYLILCRGEDGTLRRYEEFYGERGRRKFRIGFVLFFLNDLEQARRCLREMPTEHWRCDGCARTFCYEKTIGEALILWMEGEKEQALRLYGNILEAVPDDMEQRFTYEQMKKEYMNHC
ncbi:MAG: tetratricopeptide repeat protein [Clostridiales bacterium]|nr:tetratricopeptide repeat protein [Clostridiales bacterium]